MFEPKKNPREARMRMTNPKKKARPTALWEKEMRGQVERRKRDMIHAHVRCREREVDLMVLASVTAV